MSVATSVAVRSFFILTSSGEAGQYEYILPVTTRLPPVPIGQS
jgi:hypothetical protein